MPSQNRVNDILKRLADNNIYPEYSDFYNIAKINWEKTPPGVDPSFGYLQKDRTQRKRWQLENFVGLADSLLRDKQNPLIVDFCSGSGYAGLTFAYCYPNCEVILVEKKPIPIQIGKERIKLSGLPNIRLQLSHVKDFNSSFDLGVALHACGDAMDMVQIKCMENQAAYILCPCDLGFIRHSQLKFPRSQVFAKILRPEEYQTLARAADWTCWEFDSELGKLGKLCMGYVNLDRNLAAQEKGYETQLVNLKPQEATPKNDILVGWPKIRKEL